MAVASPQRPVRERNSKSLSPRRPAGSFVAGGSDAHNNTPRASFGVKAATQRLRNRGFPRADGGKFGLSKGGGTGAGEFEDASSDGGGGGGGGGERTREVEAAKTPDSAFVPRGTKGSKRAYELALKAFQDLAREFDLPSSRRVLTPKAVNIDGAEAGARTSRSASAERMSRAGSMPTERQPEDDGDDIDDAGDFPVALSASDRASGAEEEEYDDEEDLLASTFASSAPAPARFCSADACSVRKDVTRRARRLLQLPPGEPTPAGPGLGQQPEVLEGVVGKSNGLGHASAVVDGNSGGGRGSNGTAEMKQQHEQRRPVSASHFDSRNIFGIYHERDLRERPTTCRTEYVRACAKLSLSPIPVFDHLLSPGADGCDPSSSIVPDDGGGAGGNGGDVHDGSPPVFDLDLRSYGLGSKRSLAVAAFLKTFRVAELRSLNIEGCGVPESAMAAVAQALGEEGRGLTSLDISGNQIKTDATAKLIAELLEQPDSSLRSLRLRGCSLSLAALTALLLPLQYRHSRLRSLCVSRNGLGEGVGAGEALAGLIDCNIGLTDLDLSDNRLGGQQLAMVIQALAVNSSLLTLDVGWNSLCEEQAADALVEALKENRTLTRLELGYSGLGEEACLRLSEVLFRGSSGLRHLCVTGNAIGPFGAQGLLLTMGFQGAAGEDCGSGPGGGGGGEKADGECRGSVDGEVWGEGKRSSQNNGSNRGSTASSINISRSSIHNHNNIKGTSSRSSSSGGAGGGISSISRSHGGGGGGGRAGGEGKGGEGGGGAGGAWRTIDMTNCSFARKPTDRDENVIDRAANAAAFDPTAPNGVYKLNLANALDRHVARRLQRLASTQSGKCWVQPKLNGKALVFPTEGPSSFEIPGGGVLEVTFAANRPVVPPAWKEGHAKAALQKIEAGGDGVDELEGVRLAETIMELHPLTVEQGLSVLSGFSTRERARVAASLIRHNPRTEDAEAILEGLHPSERGKVEDTGSTGLFLRWFSSTNPTCRYRLRLGIPAERLAATRLADLNMLERRALQLAGLKDLSQNGGWDNFRNGSLDGKPFVYPAEGGWVPPPQGLLCIDYVSPLQPAYVEEEGDGEEMPPPPMTDKGFRDFMATHVVLEDEPAASRGKAAEKAIADAFGSFDKGGQDPSIAQAFMTKACGFPRTPSLQQVRDAIATIRMQPPQSQASLGGELSATDGEDEANTADNDGEDLEGVGGDDNGEDKGETQETKNESKGEETGGEDGGDQAEAGQLLDLERFASVWRLLMVHSLAERRLPLLRRLSSRVWLSTDQLSRMYFALKRDKNPCDPVEALVFFFRRLTDPENFYKVTKQLPDDDMERLGDALGWLNVFNPFRPDGHYRLHLNRPDEKRLASAVVELARTPIDAGKAAVLQAFPSGAFGAHSENFVPPKTWKRTLPSSGRWSFKLALESTRTDLSSSVPGSGNGSADAMSTAHGGGGGSDEAAAVERQHQKQEVDGSPGEGVSPPPTGADGQAKKQTPGTPDEESNTSAAPNAEGAAAEGDPSAARPQETPPAVSARERGIDNWPGRAACREVAENVLGWEFQDDDFVLPAAAAAGNPEGEEGGGEAAGGDIGDTEEQREDTAAVKAALARRQVKLRAFLRDVRTNEEEAGGVVGE